MPAHGNIRWTESERHTVIAEAVRLSAATPDLTTVELYRRAVQVMPKERRRPENANVVAWLSKEVKQAKRVTQAPASPPEAEDEPPAQAPDIVIRALIEYGAELVAGILSHEDVARSIRDLLSDALGRPHEIDRAAMWSGVGSAGTGKKVLIAGLKGHQMEVIRKAHGERLNLRFWESGHSKDRLRVLAKESEVSIGMTGFLSHPADAVIKSNAKTYLRNPGGLTGLKDMLARV